MRKAIIEIVKNYKFPVIIEEDASGFFVSCPAIQGCYSQGTTYEEAITNIKDAIRLHLADLLENAEKIPKTKSVSVATVEVVA
jgi:predicted RNase H-like HicB family nuclease